jgi:transposase
VEAAERSLAKEALANPDVRRLMTIPGVGMVTALAIVSVVGDVGRFPSARQLVATFRELLREIDDDLTIALEARRTTAVSS